jgi:hypothetical protein
MAVETAAQVLAAPDIDTRDQLIAAHLGQLEQELSRTQSDAQPASNGTQRPTRRSVRRTSARPSVSE